MAGRAASPLGRRRAQLEPVVEKYREYRATLAGIVPQVVAVAPDAVVLISLSAILWAGARVLFPELTNLFWGFPLFFAVFTVYYFYRYGLVYLGTHLLAQPSVGANLWRQYAYVHRLLWPLYLAVAYWALFGSQPLALIFSYFGLALYGVTTVYAIVRLFLTFFYFRHNLFFYFLYLCALEIAPPLAAIRWWYL